MSVMRKLKHDPEKWAPVFPRDKRGTRLRGDHAQTIKLDDVYRALVRWFGRILNFLRGREFKSPTSIFSARSLGRPALRFAHHEIAEDLNACHGLQLFRIDKICVQLDRIGLAEQLHKAIVFLDEIIRQRGDAEPLLTGAYQPQDVVDLEIGFAWTAPVAAGLDQPVAI